MRSPAASSPPLLPPPPPVPPSAPSMPPLPPPPVPPRVRPRRSVRQVGARVGRLAVFAAAIGLAYLIDSSIFAAVVLPFLVLAPLEKLYPRQKGQRVRRPMVGTDIGFALLGPLLNVAAIVAIILIGGLSLFWLPGLVLSPLVDRIPAAALPWVGFLLFDGVSYWTHRFAHEVPFMWRFHSVHHSPEQMDWISGFRIHPFDGVVIAPAFFFLLGAGFDAELAGVFAALQIILGLFFHANVRVRWRWLDRVVANPEFHHWHHSSEPDAVGHNYGAALPWWDLAFGTYFMPHRRTGRRPARYGVSEPLPRELLGQLTHPCRGARRHLWLWRHPIVAAHTLAVATRNLLADLRRSARRPTHSVRRWSAPGVATTNGSLVGPEAIPKPAKRPLPGRRAAQDPTVPNTGNGSSRRRRPKVAPLRRRFCPTWQDETFHRRGRIGPRTSVSTDTPLRSTSSSARSDPRRTKASSRSGCRRSFPMALAQQALTVSQINDGRLVLGIGLSHQVVVESMFTDNPEKARERAAELFVMRERKRRDDARSQCVRNP